MDSTFKTYLKPHQFSSVVAMLVQTIIIVYLDNGKSLLSSFSGLFFSSTPFLHSIGHLGTIFWESNKYSSLHSATQNLLMTPPVIVKCPSVQWPTGPSGPSYFSSFFLLLLSSTLCMYPGCFSNILGTFWPEVFALAAWSVWNVLSPDNWKNHFLICIKSLPKCGLTFVIFNFAIPALSLTIPLIPV